MKKILVPTDFSACANNAVDFVVQTAKYLPVELTLFHSFELKGNVYTDYMGVNKEFNQSLLDDVHKNLADMKSVIEETEGVNVNTFVALTPLVDAIKIAVEEKGIDLVVMGTLGATGLKEKLWGSKTAAVIGYAQVPVMVIPYEFEWKKPTKVLLVSNQFEKDPVILNYLFDMVDLFMAQLGIAVFTDEDDDKADTFMEHTHNLRQYEMMLKMEYKEDTLAASHLYGTDFEETLQWHIKENNIDILVMITYLKEKGFWERLFHPSMTKRMSYHTTIPLLVIPAK
jgi:nucleotide-binding universal stress UspA family protein